jgi:hypothetical protein
MAHKVTDVGEVWLDGEKIPDNRIREIFRPPPQVPTEFYRSALIIGAKGAGKTTLFRYHKETHPGLAVHISLATEFASLAKQSALGPLAIDYPPDVEQLVVGKATSLLAVSIAARLARKRIPIPWDTLRECIPVGVGVQPFADQVEGCSVLKSAVSRSPLEMFPDISHSRPLPDLMATLGERCEERHGPLLLLLDRADMVPPPALVPVLELLDQSGGYIALVATRPGHGGMTLVRLADAAVPGDHYDIVHLGILPRSNDWLDLVRDAVAAQLGEPARSCLPEEMREGVLVLSRDSIRMALEIFARAAGASSVERGGQALSALDDQREKHLVAVQRTLRAYHPDFRKLVNDIREQVLAESGSITGPVLLAIEGNSPETLFGAQSHLSTFLELSLRSGALCTPEGERWIPGTTPNEVEVPPLFVWRRGDKIWVAEAAVPCRITRRESRVLRVSGGPGAVPSLFVAYRMHFEESKRFKRRLEDLIRVHPSLAHWRFADGQVPAGTNWPTAIRGRINKSKVVVADVTGMRPDVLFELGFAFGLRRHFIPVVSKPEERGKLPYWLGATQVGHYDDAAGMAGIVSSIEAHFYDPEFSKTPRPPSPVPSLAVWLRVLDWNRTAMEQFRIAGEREGLKVEAYDDETPEETLIRRGTSAALLVVSLDGTEWDSLVHFVCGAVMSRPEAGYANRKLARQVLILEPPGTGQRSFTADSVARCHENVLIISLNSVARETSRFGRRHNEWANSRSKRKRG